MEGDIAWPDFVATWMDRTVGEAQVRSYLDIFVFITTVKVCSPLDFLTFILRSSVLPFIFQTLRFLMFQKTKIYF